MSPTFLPDAYVVSIRHPLQKIRAHDVVLVNHPIYGKMIKRITSITDQGFLLIGDHFSSLTTEQMGLITPQQLIGKVIWHTNPPR